jgi:hypothetical protein
MRVLLPWAQPRAVLGTTSDVAGFLRLWRVTHFDMHSTRSNLVSATALGVFHVHLYRIERLGEGKPAFAR